MSDFLKYFILFPFAIFAVSLLFPQKKERNLANLVVFSLGAMVFGTFAFVIKWATTGFQTLDIKHLSLYKSDHFDFFIDFYFDKNTAVFATVGSILLLLVGIFSRFYLHRESGFKRFFNTLLFFWLGYQLIIFSGNFETLFVGWEILGLTSFLLVTFYRDRYLPVKNGLKVLSFYRLSDVCLIISMWLSHHIWQKNVTFSEFSTTDCTNLMLENGAAFGWLAFFIVLAATIKSAQFPFSTWLPRAMEGPTSSSAIFYGALAVHIGVFLLLRTAPIWETNQIASLLIGGIGLVTCGIATAIARVQSNVKVQIGYASIAQIGLIFLEISFGFYNFALLHFAANAFLRTYQLLVSPSVLSYLTHDMLYNFVPTDKNKTVGKLAQATYLLSLKEWNLDFLCKRFLWNPFKFIGNKLNLIKNTWLLGLLVLILLFGIFSISQPNSLIINWLHYSTLLFSATSMLLVLQSFAARTSAQRAWMLLFGSQLFFAMALFLNDEIDVRPFIYYFSGSVLAFVVGYFCLSKIKQIDQDIALDKFHGYQFTHSKTGLLFLISAIAMIGFPITPTIIGVDLLITFIHPNQILLLFFIIIQLIFIELAAIRIFARIFLGQDKHNYHPIAFKSS